MTASSSLPALFSLLRSAHCALLLAIASLLAGAPSKAKADLHVVGDADHLWVVRPNKDGTGVSIQHRQASDRDGRLRPPLVLQGKLVTAGAAAGGGYLWLVYDTGTVQTLRAFEDAMGHRVFSDSLLPALPKGATLRSLATARDQPFALMRVESAALLEQLDAPPDAAPAKDSPTVPKGKDSGDKVPAAPSPQSKPKPEAEAPQDIIESPKDGKGDAGEDSSKPKPGAKDAGREKDAGGQKDSDGKKPGPTETPGKSKDEKPAASKPAPVKADRLLTLVQKRWVRVDLPTDWPQGAPAWLLSLSKDDLRPALVVAPPGENTLRWYRYSEEKDGKNQIVRTWVRREQPIIDAPAAPPLAIDQQIIVARRINTAGKLELTLSAVRPEGVSEIGTLSAPFPADGWALAQAADRIALVMLGGDQLTWLRMTTRGSASDPQPVPLATEPLGFPPVADVLIIIGVLVLATPILLVLWKRDPTMQQAALPKGVVVADLGGRAMAATVDLAPCIVAAMLITGVSLEEMIAFRPGSGAGWERMIPSAIAMGLYLGYTFLAELFTAKTIGKAMFGLRVTGLKGQPPDLWQVLGRNLFKVLDLIAPPLLAFALFSPIRQRLGDVVGRTVVVRAATPEDEEDKDSGGSWMDDDDGNDDVPDVRPKKRK